MQKRVSKSKVLGAFTDASQSLSRREFLLKASAVAALSQIPAVPTVNQSVLAYLESIKAKLTPITDYLAYLEQAAYGGMADPDTMVILWDRANDATHNKLLEIFDTNEFHDEAIFPLVGKEDYHLACARNLEGYEL